MFSTIALAPIASIANQHEYRTRSPGVERSILPQSTPPVAATADAGGGFRQSDHNPDASPDNTKARSVPATLFAAAVIAGALPPSPQSMNELIRRIGSAPIPPESQALLKDLTA